MQYAPHLRDATCGSFILIANIKLLFACLCPLMLEAFQLHLPPSPQTDFVLAGCGMQYAHSLRGATHESKGMVFNYSSKGPPWKGSITIKRVSVLLAVGPSWQSEDANALASLSCSFTNWDGLSIDSGQLASSCLPAFCPPLKLPSGEPTRSLRGSQAWEVRVVKKLPA